MAKRDFATLAKAQYQVYQHTSGGSFDMLAIHSKGSKFSIGKNALHRRATTLDASFPEMLGQHAELSLTVTQNLPRGGTVYVAGKHSRSGTPLASTRPCKYCASMLDSAGVRFVVYYQDSKPTKALVSSLLHDEDYYDI